MQLFEILCKFKPTKNRRKGVRITMEKSMKFKIILSLVAAALVIIFIVQNVAVVDIRFLFWKLSMSRSLMMFFLVIVGVVIGWFLRGASVRRQKEDQE